jgi:hypothetical protein
VTKYTAYGEKVTDDVSRVSIVRVATTDNTTNINVTPAAAITWDVEKFSYGNKVSWSSGDNTKLTAERDGLYRITAHVVMTSTVARASTNLYFKKNGTTLLQPYGAHGYIRGTATVHNFSSVFLQTVELLNATDYIHVEYLIEGVAGTVNMVANENLFMMEWLGVEL